MPTTRHDDYTPWEVRDDHFEHTLDARDEGDCYEGVPASRALGDCLLDDHGERSRVNWELIALRSWAPWVREYHTTWHDMADYDEWCMGDETKRWLLEDPGRRIANPNDHQSVDSLSAEVRRSDEVLVVRWRPHYGPLLAPRPTDLSTWSATVTRLERAAAMANRSVFLQRNREQLCAVPGCSAAVPVCLHSDNADCWLRHFNSELSDGLSADAMRSTDVDFAELDELIASAARQDEEADKEIAAWRQILDR